MSNQIISNGLIQALKSHYRQSGSSLAVKTPRRAIIASRGYSKGFTTNRFPIATALGYKWALKAGYSERQAKLLGYAISLAPNCVKNAWRSGMKIADGVAQSKKAFDETPLLNSKYVNFGRWTFALSKDRITLAKMRNLQWWGVDKYENTMARLTKNQREKLYARIDKEFEGLKANIIENRYCFQYKSWWQKLMDELRTDL